MTEKEALERTVDYIECQTKFAETIKKALEKQLLVLIKETIIVRLVEIILI